MTRLDDHRAYLADGVRLAAYERAIQAVVRPGAVVADVGSGTGILALLACRAGARRVHAIEPSGAIAIARDAARANGFADRICFYNAPASSVVLPEPCDVVLSDFIGHFGYDADLFAMARDFRRLLGPHGVSIPSTITFAASPAECARLSASVNSWRDPVRGFDFTSAFDMAANTPQTEYTEPADLVSPDAVHATVDLLSAPEVVRLCGTIRAVRSGVVRGLAAWFHATLAPGVQLTNAPTHEDRIRRRNMVLPLAFAIPVEPGDTLTIDVAIRPSDLVVNWRVAASAGQARHSSFRGLLVPDALLGRGDA